MLTLPMASMPLLASHQEEQAWNQRQLNQTVSDPHLRLWMYREPAVVLGCSQRNTVSAEQALERAGIGVTTRQAGGGAVLVGPWMLSASIVLPHSHPLVASNLTESYRWLGERFASVLRHLGVSAHAINPDEARYLQQPSPDAALDWACYGGFSPWEVVVGRRKILGLAQVRRQTGVLFVAGLLLHHPEWTLLSKVMGKSPLDADLLARRTTSCAEQLGRALPLAEIVAPLGRALQSVLEIPDNSGRIRHCQASFGLVHCAA